LSSRRSFLSRKNDVFGLDIGSFCVKAVQLRRDEAGYRLLAAAIAPIAQTKDDADLVYASAVSAIRRCLDAAKIKTKYAVCSVSGPDVAVRRFDFPSLNRDEIPNAVLFEADQVCPFDVSQSVVDYQLIEQPAESAPQQDKKKPPGDTSGVLVAATADIVSQKIRLVKGVSHSCVLMDVEGLALLNCLLGSEKIEPKQAVAVIDVGNSFTNVAILSADASPFVRDLPYAGDDIIERIALARQFSTNTVRRVLSGESEKHLTVADIADSLKDACGKLVNDIADTTRYYVARQGLGIKRIYVCGGFAQVEGFMDILQNQLNCEVVLFDPLAKMPRDPRLRDPDLVDKNGPMLALAAGLAMRTL